MISSRLQLYLGNSKLDNFLCCTFRLYSSPPVKLDGSVALFAIDPPHGNYTSLLIYPYCCIIKLFGKPYDLVSLCICFTQRASAMPQNAPMFYFLREAFSFLKPPYKSRDLFHYACAHGRPMVSSRHTAVLGQLEVRMAVAVGKAVGLN